MRFRGMRKMLEEEETDRLESEGEEERTEDEVKSAKEEKEEKGKKWEGAAKGEEKEESEDEDDGHARGKRWRATTCDKKKGVRAEKIVKKRKEEGEDKEGGEKIIGKLTEGVGRGVKKEERR